MDLVDRIGHLSNAMCRLPRTHLLHATPPIEVYRINYKGNWEYLTTISSEPTKLREGRRELCGKKVGDQ